jgi:hypothetical protein
MEVNASDAKTTPQQAGPLEGGPCEDVYFFVALQAVPVPVVPFMELPLTVPV